MPCRQLTPVWPYDRPWLGHLQGNLHIYNTCNKIQIENSKQRWLPNAKTKSSIKRDVSVKGEFNITQLHKNSCQQWLNKNCFLEKCYRQISVLTNKINGLVEFVIPRLACILVFINQTKSAGLEQLNLLWIWTQLRNLGFVLRFSAQSA